MSQITPFTHAIIQSVQAQRTIAVEKERQLRRAQALEKDIAAHEDVLEHQVESSEELQPIQDEAEQEHRRPKRQPPRRPDDDKPLIDLTA